MSSGRLKLLYVLDSSPFRSCSPAFFNTYFVEFLHAVKKEADISIYYPVFSIVAEPTDCVSAERDGFKEYTVKIPERYSRFSDVFDNPQLDEIFEKILLSDSFDMVHIISLKNHSMNYPFIASKMGVPLLVSVIDNYILTPFLFSYGEKDACHEIRYSNFVSNQLSSIIRRAKSFVLGRKKGYNWYEQIGRYSSFYNCSSIKLEQVLSAARNVLRKEVFDFTMKFHFFSKEQYEKNYSKFVSEEKLFFMGQGVEISDALKSRPFEIGDCISYGFIGDIIPEEGVFELVEALRILKGKGFNSKLHVYGEIFENADLFDRLKIKSGDIDIYFHGPVDSGRLYSVFDNFDVLVMPSKWDRPDTYLALNAVLSRRSVVARAETAAGEFIKKNGRGVAVKEITAQSLSEVFLSLENDRKRLYYYMRPLEGDIFESIESNVNKLMELYKKMSENNLPETSFVGKRLFRKRLDRIKG